MKDTKDILLTNHWTAASSIKTAVKSLIFVAHNGASGCNTFVWNVQIAIIILGNGRLLTVNHCA